MLRKLCRLAPEVEVLLGTPTDEGGSYWGVCMNARLGLRARMCSSSNKQNSQPITTNIEAIVRWERFDFESVVLYRCRAVKLFHGCTRRRNLALELKARRPVPAFVAPYQVLHERYYGFAKETAQLQGPSK